MGKIKLSSAIDKDAVFHPSSVMSTAARDALVNFEVFPLILTLHYKYGLYVHSTHGSNAEHGDIRKGTGVANIVCGYYYIYLVDKNNLPLIRIRYAPSKRRSKTGSNDPAFHIERKRFFYSHDWADMEDSHLYSTDVKALIRKVSNHEITVKQITNILNFTMARTIREVLTDGFRLYMGEVKREVSNHDWSMTKDETTILLRFLMNEITQNEIPAEHMMKFVESHQKLTKTDSLLAEYKQNARTMYEGEKWIVFKTQTGVCVGAINTSFIKNAYDRLKDKSNYFYSLMEATPEVIQENTTVPFAIYSSVKDIPTDIPWHKDLQVSLAMQKTYAMSKANNKTEYAACYDKDDPTVLVKAPNNEIYFDADSIQYMDGWSAYAWICINR
jgi:hypothetical protein